MGLNNFTIVEVSIAVKFFTETGLLALCSNPQPRGVPILIAFYDMLGLTGTILFPRHHTWNMVTRYILFLYVITLLFDVFCPKFQRFPHSIRKNHLIFP
jgi:hypothetical protein